MEVTGWLILLQLLFFNFFATILRFTLPDNKDQPEHRGH